MKCIILHLHKFAHTLISRASKPQGHEGQREALALQVCPTMVPSLLVIAWGGCNRCGLPSSCLNDESSNFHRKSHRFSQQAKHGITYEKNIFSEIAELKTRFEACLCCPWTTKTNSEESRRLIHSHNTSTVTLLRMHRGVIMPSIWDL